MDNKATLPDIHSLDIGIYSPYAPIYDALQVYFSELPDIHSLDIGMLSQYGKIADVFKEFLFQLPDNNTLDIGISPHHELPEHAD